MKPVLTLVALLPLAACSGDAAPGGTTVPARIDLASVTWINRPPAESMQELRGRPVLLEFWATWCPPCRQSMPHLNEVYGELAPRGLVVMSISDEDEDTVADFVERNHLEFPIGAESNLGDAFGVRGIPRAFLFDKEGKMVWTGHPMQPEWLELARGMLGGA